MGERDDPIHSRAKCFGIEVACEHDMEKDLRITFHGMAPSDAIGTYVRERAAKLERFSKRLTSCHVTIELPHRHHRHGKHFRICIEMVVPGRTLVVSRDPAARDDHEDPYAAVDDAFADALRMLEEWARMRRGDVKRHAPTATARR